MIRVRGHIGAWPVDLTLELDAEDWTRLGAHLTAESAPPARPATGAAADEQPLWQNALQLLREAGQMDGPQLLRQLAAMAGSEQAGKRLLVRIRHCEQIRVQAGADAAIYHWLG